MSEGEEDLVRPAREEEEAVGLGLLLISSPLVVPGLAAAEADTALVANQGASALVVVVAELVLDAVLEAEDGAAR